MTAQKAELLLRNMFFAKDLKKTVEACRVQDQTPEERVACNTPQEDGKFFYK